MYYSCATFAIMDRKFPLPAAGRQIKRERFGFKSGKWYSSFDGKGKDDEDMVRRVAGMYYLFPENENCDPARPLVLNEAGYVIYSELQSGRTAEEVARKISEQYEAPYEQVLSDVKEYQRKLSE